MDTTVYKQNRQLRCGYTTGSCAAAAAKAAAMMLFSHQDVAMVELQTPKGIPLQLAVMHMQRTAEFASCAIQKDSGDDPDVTNKVLVYAKVELVCKKSVTIDGGVGVGRVTKPGLDQSVGNAAINSVPRRMITDALLQLADENDYSGGFHVIIFIPAGVGLARKTFNPRLGIEGGISVLGTTGIVEPMSEKALIESIKIELRMRHLEGAQTLLLTPGNYGEIFATETLGLSGQAFVQCSNFIGEALDYAAELGIQKILLVGHIGKLVKIAGGIMQTHSSYADCRLELLTAHAALAGGNRELLGQIMEAVTTDEALRLLKQEKLLEPVMQSVISKIQIHLNRRTDFLVEVGAIVFSNQFGILGQTENADQLMEELT